MYLGPVLKQPLHISGTARITIKLASNKPAANLSVWLVSLPWTEGRNAKFTDNIITRGWADPQNHASIREGKPLVPGKFYSITFDLQPDDQIIPAGKQLGLMIFSSDREFTLLPKPGTRLTIDLNGTSLTLPVVGGKAVFDGVYQ
jgi:X-Pro dipeptidyl-peptidase